MLPGTDRCDAHFPIPSPVACIPDPKAPERKDGGEGKGPHLGLPQVPAFCCALTLPAIPGTLTLTAPSPPAPLLQRQTPSQLRRLSCPRPAPAAGSLPSSSARPWAPVPRVPPPRSPEGARVAPWTATLTPTPPSSHSGYALCRVCFYSLCTRSQRGPHLPPGAEHGTGRGWNRPRPRDARSGRRRRRLLTARLPSSSRTLRGRRGEA